MTAVFLITDKDKQRLVDLLYKITLSSSFLPSARAQMLTSFQASPASSSRPAWRSSARPTSGDRATRHTARSSSRQQRSGTSSVLTPSCARSRRRRGRRRFGEFRLLFCVLRGELRTGPGKWRFAIARWVSTTVRSKSWITVSEPTSPNPTLFASTSAPSRRTKREVRPPLSAGFWHR